MSVPDRYLQAIDACMLCGLPAGQGADVLIVGSFGPHDEVLIDSWAHKACAGQLFGKGVSSELDKYVVGARG